MRSTCCGELGRGFIGHSLALLDDLVSAGEDRWRHGQAECLCGVKIDDQFEIGRLLDRQIGRLVALQDPSGVGAHDAIGAREDRSIADQAAGD